MIAHLFFHVATVFEFCLRSVLTTEFQSKVVPSISLATLNPDDPPISFGGRFLQCDCQLCRCPGIRPLSETHQSLSFSFKLFAFVCSASPSGIRQASLIRNKSPLESELTAGWLLCRLLRFQNPRRIKSLSATVGSGNFILQGRTEFALQRDIPRY